MASETVTRDGSSQTRRPLGVATVRVTALLISCGIGFLLVRSLLGMRADRKDSLAQGMVYAYLDGDGGLDARHASGVKIMDATRDHRILVWNQPIWTGAVDDDIAKRLITSGQGEALESRLIPPQAKMLKRALAATDRELRTFSKLVEDEVSSVLRSLRSRTDRYVVIESSPRTADKSWPTVRKWKAEVEASAKGVVLGDRYVDTRDAIVYFKVLWREWPLLQRLQKRRAAMISVRRHRVADWIKAQFESNGMQIFESGIRSDD